MIRKNKQIELWKQFKKLKTDYEKWAFIIDNKFMGIKIHLYSDNTFGRFEWDEDGDYLFHFDDYIGWEDGIMTLLDVIGIDREDIWKN